MNLSKNFNNNLNNIHYTSITPPLHITAVENGPIGKGQLTLQTVAMKFQIGLFYVEELTFYIISSPLSPIILGYPWLSMHDTQISWRQGELLNWSPFCHAHCFNDCIWLQCLTMWIESQLQQSQPHIPSDYSDMMEARKEQGEGYPTVTLDSGTVPLNYCPMPHHLKVRFVLYHSRGHKR